ncbi:MAG: ArnT family glycosyltransferase [Chthoniobacterales bacterium]
MPWVEEDNFYGALYSQAAHNNLRAGLAVTGGVPATLYFGPLPIPADAYYVHHPILLPMMVTGAVAFFGEKEWVAKLVPIFCSIASALFLWFLVRDTVGRRAAALVVAFFAALPMELHYGDMVDFEPCLVMWMLAALVCLRLWAVRETKRWGVLAALCCFGAVWTDWPGYLFVVSVSVSFWLTKKPERRRFALVLIGIAAVSGILFLFDIRHANPNSWRDLWTAFTMRTGSGLAPGSSGGDQVVGPTFSFAEWCRRIFQALDEDYLRLTWFFVLAGGIYLLRNRKLRGLWWLGWAALQMAAAGVPYLLLLRNWSFIHDFASFFVIGSIAILGGLGIEAALVWLESRRLKAPHLVGAIVAAGLLVGMAIAGLSRAENLRSQLLMLDGKTAEPKDLIPNVGRYLAKTFPADTTILSNFDAYYSPLDYYAQRTIIRNLGSDDEWNSAATAAAPRIGGIVWLAAPSAFEILAALPKSETTEVEIDGVRFAVWKPG